MKVMIDSSIFVNFLNDEPGSEKTEKFLKKVIKGKIRSFISVITLTELMSVYYKKDPKKAIFAISLIEDLIDSNYTIPVVNTIATLAGRLKSKYSRFEKRPSLGDSLILASAMVANCDLVVSLDFGLKKVEEITVKRPEEV